MTKKWLAAFFTLFASVFAGTAVNAQVGPIIDALPADREYVQNLVSEIPAFQSMDSFAKVAALRELVFRKTPLAADATSRFTGRISISPLEEALEELERTNSGVWCSHTAQVFARALKAAGFDAWIYHYGRPDLLTHSTVLVRIDGDVYLQDAYLNFWFEDENGRQMPFLEALNRMSSAALPPPIAASISRKPGYFQSERQADTWNDDTTDPPDCAPVGSHLLCHTSVTLVKFTQENYLVESTLDFLESRGLPRGIEFLMLFPMDVVSLYSDTGPQAAYLSDAIDALAAPYQDQ